MNKCGTDPKVKKTLVRNCEQKIKSTRNVVRDVACTSNKLEEKSSRFSQQEYELSQPTLCSSEVLANYLSDVRKTLPSVSVSHEHGNVDESQLKTKLTKKLNFHFNDRIYKNLIELNASVEEIKNRKDRRPTSSNSSIKRDLEPNIEDFYQDEEETDIAPNIPISKPKFKAVKRVDDGQLHRLVALFEDL